MRDLNIFLKNFFMTYLEITRKLEKSKVSFIGICQPIVSDCKQN